MALSDVKYWFQAPLKTIQFYKELNRSVLSDITGSRLQGLDEYRYGSVYFGTDVNNPVYNGFSVKGVTVPSGYTSPAVSAGRSVAKNKNYPQESPLMFEGAEVGALVTVDRLSNIMERLASTRKIVKIPARLMGSYININPIVTTTNLNATVATYNSTLIEVNAEYQNGEDPVNGYKLTPVNTNPEDLNDKLVIMKVEWYITNKNNPDGARVTVSGTFFPTCPMVASGCSMARDIISQTTNMFTWGNKFYMNTNAEIVGAFSFTKNVPAHSPTSITGGIPPFNISVTGSSRSSVTSGNYDANINWIMPFYMADTIVFNNEAIADTSYTWNKNPIAFEISSEPLLENPLKVKWGKVVDIAGISAQVPIFKHGDKVYAASTDGWGTQYDFPYFDSFEDIAALFADWGIFATDNPDEIKYGKIPPLVPSNPTPGGGDSGLDPNLPPTGAGGDEPVRPGDIPNDPTNKIDDFPVTPPLITPANLCNSYVYNISQVRQLFKWLCTKGFFENLSELFADKLSAIYGIMMFPFDLLQHDSAHLSATNKTTIVNVSDDISGYILESGYNCIVFGGEIEYISYYGNFADWDKCSYSVYIPYGGVVDVPSSAVVNRHLTLQYVVDILTGKATAVIKSYGLGDRSLGVLVKCVPCQIGQSVPVQSNNYAQREVSNAMSAIGMGFSALNTVVGAATGNPLSLLYGTEGLIKGGADIMSQQQLKYCATGSISPSSGFGLPQTAFLSIARSRQINAARYGDLVGNPTQYTIQLDSVATGNNLVKCESVVLNAPSATSQELNEIRALLQSGVYI